MRSLHLACLAATGLALAPHIANCEPIVETFEPNFQFGLRTIDLPSINPDMPDIILIDFFEVVMGGLQKPAFTNPGYDSDGCGPRPFACEQLARPTGAPGRYDTTPIGALIDNTLNGWDDAYGCTEFETRWPVILNGSTGTGEFCLASGDCPSFYGTYTGLGDTEANPVNAVVPLRIEGDGGAWHYGWVAFRIENLVFPDCMSDLCFQDDPADEDVWTYLAFGYETEPGVPIINGGGLCESDVNFDAVLDLADVQTFAQSFLAADGLADINDDGIFDLADIQRFVGSFNTGCGF